MMRDAGVMRTGPPEKRPAVDDKGPAAHRSQVRSTEAPSRAATQEDRIELPPILTLDIDEWLFVIARGQPGFDLPDPTAGRPMSVADIDHSDDSRSG